MLKRFTYTKSNNIVDPNDSAWCDFSFEMPTSKHLNKNHTSHCCRARVWLPCDPFVLVGCQTPECTHHTYTGIVWDVGGVGGTIGPFRFRMFSVCRRHSGCNDVNDGVDHDCAAIQDVYTANRISSKQIFRLSHDDLSHVSFAGHLTHGIGDFAYRYCTDDDDRLNCPVFSNDHPMDDDLQHEQYLSMLLGNRLNVEPADTAHCDLLECGLRTIWPMQMLNCSRYTGMSTSRLAKSTLFHPAANSFPSWYFCKNQHLADSNHTLSFWVDFQRF